MTGDPFARARAKTRRTVVLAASGLVLVIAGVSGLLWWRSPERIMDRKRAVIDDAHGRYCKILENEKKTEPAARTASARPSDAREMVSVGLMTFDDYEALDGAPGDLDTIELDALSALCEGKRARGESLQSVLVGIVEPNDLVRGHYTKAGLARAVTALERVEYLLVVRLTEMSASRPIGDKQLVPGRFKAHAAVWRVADGSYVNGADVSGDGPHFGFVEKGHEDIQLKIQTDDALKKAIAHAVEEKGIRVKMR